MVKGRGDFEWSQTSMMLAVYINANRKKGARAVTPEQLNPFAEPSRAKADKPQLSQKESIEVLRRVFIHGG
jgi:hypothetical protein